MGQAAIDRHVAIKDAFMRQQDQVAAIACEQCLDTVQGGMSQRIGRENRVAIRSHNQEVAAVLTVIGQIGQVIDIVDADALARIGIDIGRVNSRQASGEVEKIIAVAAIDVCHVKIVSPTPI